MCFMHTVHKLLCVWNGGTFLCPSCSRFLQIAVFSKKKSYEGEIELRILLLSHNNSAREHVVGRRTYFFTSIPYTSDQLSSTCCVTLYGGFNRQAACITKQFCSLSLFYFRSILILAPTHRRQIIYIIKQYSIYFIFIFDDTRDMPLILFAKYATCIVNFVM